MEPIRIGLLGLGTVGTGVLRIVEEHRADLESQVGSPIEIAKVLVRDLNKPRAIDLPVDKLTDNAYDIINDPSIHIVIEVIGGTTQAKEYMLAAIEQGKHIVTANKDLMATHGVEIMKLAKANQCDVFYEASVAGGIPILRTLVQGFASDRITKIMGIVNGTTNYILSKMSEEGVAYEDVLKEAQELGYAEADPTSDVEGIDAAYKMTILGTLGFHVNVSVKDVERKGISQVTKEDIANAKMLGYELKLLGIAENDNGAIRLSVQPTMVKHTHPLASVNGVFNAVYVYGSMVGETMFYGPGAGELPTATSVVADVVAVAKNLKLGVSGKSTFVAAKQKKLKTDDEVSCRNFILLSVADKAGALAQITQAFAENNVSISSVVQPPRAHNHVADVIVITHDATISNMKNVFAQLENMDAVDAIKSVYRVEG